MVIDYEHQILNESSFYVLLHTTIGRKFACARLQELEVHKFQQKYYAGLGPVFHITYNLAKLTLNI